MTSIFPCRILITIIFYTSKSNWTCCIFSGLFVGFFHQMSNVNRKSSPIPSMDISGSNRWRYCTIFLAIFSGDIPIDPMTLNGFTQETLSEPQRLALERWALSGGRGGRGGGRHLPAPPRKTSATKRTRRRAAGRLRLVIPPFFLEVGDDFKSKSVVLCQYGVVFCLAFGSNLFDRCFFCCFSSHRIHVWYIC